MRLKYVYVRLKYAHSLIGKKPNKINNNAFSVTSWNNFKLALYAIIETNLFTQQTEIIRNLQFFHNENDSFNIGLNDYNELTTSLNQIKVALPIVLEAFASMKFAENDKIVSIKLPKVSNLDDLAKTTSTLNTVFSQTLLNKKINGQVKFENFDVGSSWIDIFVGSDQAIALVAGMVWSAAVIYKKMQEGKMFKHYVNGLTIKNDSLKDLQKGQSELIDKLISTEATALHKKHFDDTDKDQIIRLTHSIKLLSELINNGAEVHPSLLEPEEVSNLFPDFKQLEGIESKVKKITTGKKKD